MRKTRRKKVNRFDLYLAEGLENSQKIEPRCKHFGDCGGCDFQNINYQDQIKAKGHVVNKLIEHRGLKKAFENHPVEIVGSPEEFYYRPRVDLIFAFGKSGFRQKGSFKHIVNLDECHLMRPGVFEAFEFCRNQAIEMGFEGYDYFNHEGYLRYFVIRQTRSGKRLISLLTKTDDNEEKISALAEKLLAEKVCDSVYWIINTGVSDVAYGPIQHYWGDRFISETFHGHEFQLSANTFFQSNAEVAEKAYGMIHKHASSFDPKRILDLYSGTCTIGIVMSDLADEIVAVENIPDNRDIAHINFEKNGISNINYINDDCHEFIKTYEEHPDYIVCNPPRTGVEEKALRRVLSLGAKGMAYLSCNPETLMEDLGIMTLKYDIDGFYVFDMFPQTKHFETLVLLKRKDT